MTNIIKDLELYEISVVSVPMNPYALSKSVEDLLEVEDHEDEESEEENDVEAIAEVQDEEKVEESESEE
jgi:phage head maturation protease